MNTLRSSRYQARVVALVLSSMSCQWPALAADVSNTPLATQSSASVRANLMFILDDSGSMDNEYMPDTSNFSNLCFGVSSINRAFYDPATIYKPPLRADGLPLPDAVFTAAYVDGYKQSGTTTDLSNVANLTTPTTRVGTTATNTAINSRFYYASYKANASPATPACGSGYDWRKWDIVTSAAGWTAAQQTNYANWYSFYRQRMYTMRAGVGRVLAAIDASRFRIGYTTISSNSYTNSSTFLPIGDFDAGSQKTDFYAKLYAAPTSGSTPLRPALERIGKYYANKKRDNTALPAGTADPLQFSCQRNYAILTTDGYWNRGDEPSNYTPTRLDGTAIGNQDNASPRPLRDDGRTVGGNWVTGGAGVANSLADIAMYFYEADLRGGTTGSPACIGSIANQDVCENNVVAVGVDTASHQHMTTYAVGLGIAGQLTYSSTYDTDPSGDFFDIKNGTRPWPNPDVGSSSSSIAARADDVWHAAVNGRGRYFAANSPADLVTGLTAALEQIATTEGTGAAAATSSLQPITGDNFVYVAQYWAGLWEGNIQALTVDPVTAVVSTTPLWQAKDTVRAQTGPTSDSRTIYFRNPAVAGSALSPFTYAHLDATGKGASFANLCQAGNFKLSQCASISVNQGASAMAAANDGGNVVNWLRGRRGNEDRIENAVAARVFRQRLNTPLGDIVNAAPVYVKKSPFRYADAGYAAHQSSMAGRTGVVYAASNDGMLHAFDAATGAELWAYVPTAVIPNLYRLADYNYDANHRFFVDGSPIVGDVFDGSTWRTVLVGGLGAGGRSYYALDITDPSAPKSLWEFSSADDADLGLTFGNPVITKNKAGTWVVAFTSGVNNINPGSGNGHLFVRDAITGAALTKIPTQVSAGIAAGTVASPSSLSKINAWVDSDDDNTAKRMYGGDMLGYLWRFDFDNNIAPAGNEAFLLGRALSGTGVPQPVTTKPVLTKVGGVAALPTVTFATGRYLGASDVGDTTTQSIYVVKDPLMTTGLGTVRSNAGMVQQTMSGTTIGSVATRRVNLAAVDWGTKNGWFIDLSLTPGERVTVDMLQTGRLLAVASNSPAPTACNAGGDSWLYVFDMNGSIVEAWYRDELTVGLTLGKFGESTFVTSTNAKGKLKSDKLPPPTPTVSTLRRTSWRELVN